MPPEDRREAGQGPGSIQYRELAGGRATRQGNRLEPPKHLSTDRGAPWIPWAILALILLASAAFAFWAGRGTTFRGDDWDLLINRSGFNSDVFLVPHNEHLSALLVVAFKAIPGLFGPHYGALRAGLLILDLAVAILFFVFARERVGAWLALLATAPLLLLGGGSDNLLWPTQIGVVGSLASGLGVLIALDRSLLAAKIGACALLTISIWFSSDGLFFLAAAIIWLGFSRERWRDLWIVAIPALTYLAWYSGYGGSEFTPANLRATPQFVLDSAAGGLSALTGIRPQVGHAKAIGAVGAVLGLAALIVLAVKIRPRLSSRLVAIVALPLLSWVIIALGRAAAGDPFASRYVYASALFILMAVLEIVRGERIQKLLSGWRFGVLALVVGISMLSSARILVEKGNDWRSVSEYNVGRVSAVELTRRTVNPALPLEPLQDMGHTTAGWYLDTVERFGESPVGHTKVAGLGEHGRSAADQVLAVAAPSVFMTPPGKPTATPPTVDPGWPRPERRGSCLRTAPGQPVSVLVPPGGISARPQSGYWATFMLRRFASTYKEAPSHAVTTPTLMIIARDHSHAPWHARISSPRAVTICGGRAPLDLRRGPVLPSSGPQGCAPASLGESECHFRRY
jgi:hypothetical protein